MTVCAYCGGANGRAVHIDHVVPRAIRRRFGIADSDARYHVPSCFADNIRKGTRKYYPAGFDVSLLPGKGWQLWDGGDHLEVVA
jgi:hypothetical protein